MDRSLGFSAEISGLQILRGGNAVGGKPQQLIRGLNIGSRTVRRGTVCRRNSSPKKWKKKYILTEPNLT